MSSQVSTFMQNSSDIEHMEKRAKNPTFWQSMFNSQNIEKVALDSLIARKKMQKHRQDLKNMIMMSYGQAGWEDFLKTEISIRRKRAELVHQKEIQKDKIINAIGIIVLILTIIGFFVLLFFIWKANKG
tara:strand:- start:6992 stop:7378 length:387 start_codon:yes stop_codon:yes gene_type:complete